MISHIYIHIYRFSLLQLYHFLWYCKTSDFLWFQSHFYRFSQLESSIWWIPYGPTLSTGRPPRWPFPLDFSSRFPTPSSRCMTRMKSSMGRWNLGTKMVKNGGFTLWLCQNSYGTWPLSSLIYLLKHGDFPVRKLLNDQRVTNHQLVNGDEATN